MSRHLTLDELIHLMYRSNEEPALMEADSHVAGCADCAGRLSAMQGAKAAATVPAAVTNEFLAAQRRAIYTKLGQEPRPAYTAWVPALGAAALLAIAVSMYHPVHPQTPAAPNASDEQLFSEVYSMEQSDEPTVAAPLHSLFEGSEKN